MNRPGAMLIVGCIAIASGLVAIHVPLRIYHIGGAFGIAAGLVGIAIWAHRKATS